VSDKVFFRDVHVFDDEKGETIVFEAGTELDESKYGHLLQERENPDKNSPNKILPPRLGDHVFEPFADHNAGVPLVPQDYSSMDRNQLQEEIDNRITAGAVINPASTRKADLVAALVEHDSLGQPAAVKEDVTA